MLKTGDSLWETEIITIILSALASLMPFIAISAFLGVKATASTVWKPASSNFLQSEALMPQVCNYINNLWAHVDTKQHLERFSIQHYNLTLFNNAIQKKWYFIEDEVITKCMKSMYIKVLRFFFFNTQNVAWHIQKLSLQKWKTNCRINICLKHFKLENRTAHNWWHL